MLKYPIRNIGQSSPSKVRRAIVDPMALMAPAGRGDHQDQQVGKVLKGLAAPKVIEGRKV